MSKDFCDQQLEMQIAMHQCRILTYMGKSPECVARGLEALSFFKPRLSALLTDPVAANAYESELLEDIVRGDQGLWDYRVVQEASSSSGQVSSRGTLPSRRDDRPFSICCSSFNSYSAVDRSPLVLETREVHPISGPRI